MVNSSYNATIFSKKFNSIKKYFFWAFETVSFNGLLIKSFSTDFTQRQKKTT